MKKEQQMFKTKHKNIYYIRDFPSTPWLFHKTVKRKATCLRFASEAEAVSCAKGFHSGRKRERGK